MSSMAKSAREAMKAKATRLTGMSNTQKPFYPAGENAGDQVGMAPISKRQFQKGGKVVGKASGDVSKDRADRVARKSGGRLMVDDLVNRDVKAANKKREGGDDHVGGYKKGGKVKPKKPLEKAAMSKAAPAAEPAKKIVAKAMPKLKSIEGKSPPGGESGIRKSVAAEAIKPKAAPKVLDESTAVAPDGAETPEEEEVEANPTMGLKKGGRTKKWGGGALGEKKKSSGKKSGKGGPTNISIIIAGDGGDKGAAPAMPPGPIPPRGSAPGPQPVPGMPPMQGGMPPGVSPMMPPPPPGGPGMPPVGRKAGGRLGFASLKAGSGSGLGRLQKSGLA